MASPCQLSIGTLDDSLPLIDSEEVYDGEDSPQDNVFFRKSGVKTVLVGLKFPCALYFQGILELNVLSGSAIINGYCASEGDPRLPLRLFSTKESSAYCIIPTDHDISSVDVYKFHVKLQPLVRDLLDRIGRGCVLCVSPRTSSYVHWKLAFRKHQLDYFPDPSKATGLSLFRSAEKILDTILDVKDGSRITRKQVVSQELDQLANTFTKELSKVTNPRFLVCGGKGVGKSTCLKFIINKCLNVADAILYIDLDVGQPEFTLSGCISAVLVARPLIGPNFSHSTVPIRSYFVGDANPIQCLNAYLIGLKKLALFCQSDDRCKLVPWFINTMGMTKSLGLDFIALTMVSFKPHHVLQINSSWKPHNFSATLSPSYMRKFVPKLPMSPLDDISYVHHSASSLAKSHLRSVSVPAAPKLREAVAVEFLSTLLISQSGSEVHRHELSNDLKHKVKYSGMIHGDLVALCQQDEDANVLLAYGVITLQPSLSVLSFIGDATFSHINAIERVPVKFKGTSILDYLPCKAGAVPNVCSFGMPQLAEDRREVMKILFGLE